MRRLEQPRTVGRSTGEGAFGVPEELRLEQLLGDGRAVDRGKAHVVPRAHAVDGLRKHFLARAALAGDEHRRIVAGNAARELQQIAHDLALGHHQIACRVGADARAERLHLAPEPLPLLRLADGHGDFIGAEGFPDVVVRTLAHGSEGGILGPISAHHDDQRGAPLGPVPAQEGDPVHARHLHVAQDEIELLRDGPPQRLLGIGFGHYVVAGLPEQETE